MFKYKEIINVYSQTSLLRVFAMFLIQIEKYFSSKLLLDLKVTKKQESIYCLCFSEIVQNNGQIALYLSETINF